MSPNLKPRNTAFTLVEVLIVIAIMSFLVILVIPRVRMVNKDRNIRETARVVGSMFNGVSNRARVDGSAGVMLVKNPNFEDATGDVFAATAMYRMRHVDPYVGQSPGEGFRLTFNTATEQWFFEILLPLQTGVVRPGDVCEFGGGAGRRVVGVDDPSPNDNGWIRIELEILDANCDVLMPGATPDLVETSGPGLSDTRPWVIKRRPRIVESSRVDLPEGYVVDMRYSDFLPGNNLQPASRLRGFRFKPGTGWTQIAEPNHSVVVIFNEEGGIDYVDDEFATNWVQPFSPLQMLISEFDPEGSNPLNKDQNLWVQVNHIYGGVNVGYNVSTSFADTDVDTNYVAAVLESQVIASSTARD